MNAQQLRNSILQEAIEGRLVPQDPNDEPASVLLERIREEKKRLLKEGKLKKKDLDETPISEDEKPFEIPDSWEWVRLGEIAYLKSGNQYAESNFGFLYLKVADMNLQENKIEINASTRFTLCQDESYIPQFSIIFPKRGGAISTNKKRLVLKDKVFVDSNTMGITPFLKTMLSFLYIWFDSIDLGELSTGTSVPQINNKDLLPLYFPLPPLAEQKRIVAKIEELLPKVEKYGKAQEALDKLNEELPERLKKSVLQEAIEGRLVPQDPNDEPASALLECIREEKKRLVKEGKLKKKDLEETPISEDEKPFEIPDSWEWVRISDISESFIGFTYKPTDVSTNGWIVLRSSNIQEGILDYNDIVKVNVEVSEKLRVRVNDIIICARNGSKKLVGKSALVREVNEPTTFGAFMAICRTQFYEYLAKYLLSPLFFQQLRKESDTTTINQLTQKNFNRYLVPLPPLAEQKRIVAKIEEVFKEIEKL